MKFLRQFWKTLGQNIGESWGDIATSGIETVKTAQEFGKTLKEQAPHIEQLKPYVQQIEPFLQVFDAPVTQLAVSGLPFLSIGIAALKVFSQLTKQEPTFEEAVVVALQLAYLESLAETLAALNPEYRQQLEQVKLAKLLERQIEKLEPISDRREAEAALHCFRESKLAERFNQTLTEQLQPVGLPAAFIPLIVERVSWNTPRFLYLAIAAAGEEIKPLAEFLRLGGQARLDKYESTAAYLNDNIKPLPDETIFDEQTISFRDLYVPLEVQPLDQDGKPIENQKPINIHEWVRSVLESPEKPRRVLFIEGDAGRGKSVFCRMFADFVRVSQYFGFVPILIRLRNVRTLENNLTQTLTTYLETIRFVQRDHDWLTDPNTRFLLLFDGFDELLLQGRDKGLKEFLQQVADFQERSHHQCLVTGRPLALQGIERLITQTARLQRMKIEPMNDVQRQQWLANWAKQVGEPEAKAFEAFLQPCPDEIQDNLAREPLLLYLLARLHREEALSAQMFAEAEGIQARVKIYQESVRWVLEKQRQTENFRQTGLESDDLRQVLTEAALCVVQSGNETAQLSMLMARCQQADNPVMELLKKSQEETAQKDEKALNNLLTAFYINPAATNRTGAVEFAHKSFGEFLFAERLKESIEAWTEPGRKREKFYLNDQQLEWQIYDLLGYGGLTVEVVEYLMALLQESEDFKPVELYQRLYHFYINWSNGEYIDQIDQNLPQRKQKQMHEFGIPSGIRQADVYAGLNVLILLLELHRYAQAKDDLKDIISFHPCGVPNTEEFDQYRLLRTIHYSDSFEIGTFLRATSLFLSNANLNSAFLNRAKLIGTKFSNANLSSANLISTNLINIDLFNANLSGANLSGANLSRADLSSVDLSNANLISTILFNANLSGANLIGANLIGASLISADLSNADLSSACLSSADLSDIAWDENTRWLDVKGLGTARNIPEALKQKLGI